MLQVLVAEFPDLVFTAVIDYIGNNCVQFLEVIYTVAV